jgi:hypothetical protein
MLGQKKGADHGHQAKDQTPPAADMDRQSRAAIGKPVHRAMDDQVLVVIDQRAHLGEEPVRVALQMVEQVVAVDPKCAGGDDGVVEGGLGSFLVP